MSEARVKLTVDTTEAQKQVKLIDDQINSLGKGSKGVDVKAEADKTAGGSGSKSDMATLVNLQTQFNKKFESYIGDVSRNNETIIKKLDAILGNNSGSGQGNNVSSTTGQTTTGATNQQNQSTPTPTVSTNN